MVNNLMEASYFKQIVYNKNITVFYDQTGGGCSFGQNFIPFIAAYPQKFNTALEWCSGAGFIGFSLLAHNLCNHITLLEKNKRDHVYLNMTIHKNNLQKSAKAVRSDNFKYFKPDSDFKGFDLIVGNPPHFNTLYRSGPSESRLTNDIDWNIHKEFFRTVHQFIHSKSHIILVENNKHCLNSLKDLKQIASQYNLKLNGIYASEKDKVGTKFDLSTDLLPSDLRYYFLDFSL